MPGNLSPQQYQFLIQWLNQQEEAEAPSMGDVATDVAKNVGTSVVKNQVKKKAAEQVGLSGLMETAPGTAGASFLPTLGLAAGAYTGKEQFTGLKNFAEGEDLSITQKAALALPTFGLSLFSDQLSDLFGLSSDKWKTEGKRIKKLREKGVDIPDSPTGADKLTRGRSTDELIRKDYAADYVGSPKQGDWVNNKFATSRDEKDLKAEDIWGYSAFAEHDPDWYKKSEEERRSTAQKALDSGAVDEHHGTVDIDWSKFESPTMSNASDPARAAPLQMPTNKVTEALARDGAVDALKQYRDLGSIDKDQFNEAIYNMGKEFGPARAIPARASPRQE